MSDSSKTADKLKKYVNAGDEDKLTDSEYKELIKSLVGICENCAKSAFSREITKDESGSISERKFNAKYLIENVDNCVLRTLKYIVYCIQNRYLTPDRFLIWLIVELDPVKIKVNKDKTYMNTILLLMSFCLRYGADPNMYIMEPDLGKIHLLVFLIKRFQEKKLFPYGEVKDDFTKQILLLFCLLGSKVSFKAKYPETEIKISGSTANRKIIEEARKTVNPQAENATVRDLLNGVGYAKIDGVEVRDYSYDVYDEPYEDPKFILKQQADSSGILANEFIIKFGYLIDDPEFALINVKSSVYIDFDKVLRYNAIRVLQSSQIDDDANEIKFRHESIRLIQAIECIALEAFVELLQRGTKMSYFTMNRLLLKIKHYTVKAEQKNYNRIYSEVYLAMLKSALALGVPMDFYQNKYIADAKLQDSSLKNVTDMIKEIYEKPLYDKVCKTSKKSELPKSIKLLATSLGVGVDLSNVYYNDKIQKSIFSEPSKEEICSGIYSIVKQDSDKFKADAKDRLRKRIQLTAPKIDDYTKGRVSDVDCVNPGGVYGDPLKYNDATLVYYRDKSDSLFCFPANMFKELSSSGVNPITNDPLPLDVQIKIAKSLEIFKIMNINADNILTVEDAYKQLIEADTFSKSRTDYAVETIKLLFLSRGLKSNYIDKLDIKLYNKMLEVKNVNMAQDYFQNFKDADKSFIFAIFCKALYSSIKEDDKIYLIPDILNDMIKVLKDNTISSESSSKIATEEGRALLGGGKKKK
jgi:hypothetical protein